MAYVIILDLKRMLNEESDNEISFPINPFEKVFVHSDN